MGRYIDYEELTGRYSQLFKGSEAESVGSHYIAFAEAEVDGRLGRTYSVPFDTTSGAPDVVKDLAIDIAYLKATIGGKSKAWDGIKKSVDERFEMLLNGDMVILDASGSALTVVGDTVWSSTMNYHPVFGIGSDLDFVIDEDRLDDEEDARD